MILFLAMECEFLLINILYNAQLIDSIRLLNMIYYVSYVVVHSLKKGQSIQGSVIKT